MKVTKTSVGKRLDTVWSELVRSKGKCEVCGRANGVLNAHHIIGRKNRTLRWDLKNGCCLCYQHHKGGRQSAHEDPEWFRFWLKGNRAEDFEYINRTKNNITKWQLWEMQEHLEELNKLKQSK